MNKKRLKTAEKKCFDQLSDARSNRKLVEIHNTHYEKGWETLF